MWSYQVVLCGCGCCVCQVTSSPCVSCYAPLHQYLDLCISCCQFTLRFQHLSPCLELGLEFGFLHIHFMLLAEKFSFDLKSSALICRFPQSAGCGLAADLRCTVNSQTSLSSFSFMFSLRVNPTPSLTPFSACLSAESSWHVSEASSPLFNNSFTLVINSLNRNSLGTYQSTWSSSCSSRDKNYCIYTCNCRNYANNVSSNSFTTISLFSSSFINAVIILLFRVSVPSLPWRVLVSFKLFFSRVFILDCTLGFIFISHLVIWLRVLQQCFTLQSSVCFATIASQTQTNGVGYSRLAALTVTWACV